MAEKVFHVVTAAQCRMPGCGMEFGFEHYVRASDNATLLAKLNRLRYKCPSCGDDSPKFFPEGLRMYAEDIPVGTIPLSVEVL